MSKVLQDPPAEWLEANGFIPEGVPCLSEPSRLALRTAYEEDMKRQAAHHEDPFHDNTELLDVPFPEVFDVAPDYSQLPKGVEPGSIEEARMNEFLERHYGYNDSSNPEIAA